MQFGKPDFDVGLRNAVRRRVRLRAGRLVLFPSMFWHGMTPFGEAAQRLTIVFDVKPTCWHHCAGPCLRHWSRAAVAWYQQTR